MNQTTQMSEYLLSIAEKIICESAPNQIHKKYSKIKQSLINNDTITNFNGLLKQDVRLKTSNKLTLKKQQRSCKILSQKQPLRVSLKNPTPQKKHPLNKQHQTLSKSTVRSRSRTVTFNNKQNTSPITKRRQLIQNQTSSKKTIINKSNLKDNTIGVSKRQSNNLKQREINSIFCHEDILQRKLFGTTDKNNHHQEFILKNHHQHSIIKNNHQESILQDKDFNAIMNKKLSKTFEQLLKDKLNENKQNLSDDNIRLLLKIQQAISKTLNEIPQQNPKRQMDNKIVQKEHENLFKKITIQNSPCLKQYIVNKNDQHKDKQILRYKSQIVEHIIKQKELRKRNKQIKKDNKWLIQNAQLLLIQNQQLKRLVVQK